MIRERFLASAARQMLFICVHTQMDAAFSANQLIIGFSKKSLNSASLIRPELAVT